MADYIKRTLALDVINHANDCDCFKNYDGYSMAFDMIDEMPRADVQKVKHGKWVICSDGYYPYCSNCNNEPPSKELTEFCPRCGAKMDLKE